MFKRATKSELKTWMIGDLLIVALLLFISLSMISDYTNTDKVSTLIWGLVFLFIGILLIFFFYNMIIAFKTYEERMEEMQKLEEEERIKREAEEQERLRLEEEETKKFIEEYQKKVQEAEEQRKLEQEQKGKK